MKSRIGFLSVFNFGTNVGGIENHIYFMARELHSLGYDVVIFQPVDSTEQEDESEERLEFCTLVKLPVKFNAVFRRITALQGRSILGFGVAFINKLKFSLASKQIAAAILRRSVSIVHQHDFMSNIRTTKILKKKGITCILTNHTGEYLFLKSSILGRFALPHLLNHFDVIIGPSKELTPHQYNKNSTTIYNGVDVSIFRRHSPEKNETVRAKYGLKKSDFVVLCPRRWAPTKGVLYLIRSIIEHTYPENYRFIFAGSDYNGYPKYAQELNAILGTEKGQHCARKLGNLSVDDMVDAYNIADAVIIPSLMEAVSLSAVEAMATGTPVVSTNVGGMPELITDGVNGVLINPKSEGEIHEALLKLQDSALYGLLVKNSLSTAERYTWRSIAIETSKVYQQHLS